MVLRTLRDRLASHLPPVRLDQAPEFWGPTDINAQSGNGRLSVALNRTGTVTVLRWPRPSYYDHVTHHTTHRDAPRFGAHPNEGSFLGLRVTTVGDAADADVATDITDAADATDASNTTDAEDSADAGTAGGTKAGTDAETETHWLRDWPTEQRYADERSDAVVTTHRHDGLGLCVRIGDVVAADADALVREVTVERRADSPVIAASLVVFANLDLVVSKRPLSPTQDLYRRLTERTRARYHPDLDAVVFSKAGVDRSTDDASSVAIAVGFGDPSGTTRGFEDQSADDPSTADPLSDDPPSDEPSSYHVGADERRSARAGDPVDAYRAASAGALPGGRFHEGKTTAALARPLVFAVDGEGPGDDGHDRAGKRPSAAATATATVRYAAATTADAAGDLLDANRRRSPADLRAAKRAWFDDRLGDAPMPATDDPVVTAVAWRGLVTLVTNYDPESGAVVASIATRSPYALDWPRDGAFCNHVLDRIGRSDWARKRNRWYASLQERSGRHLLGAALVPAGTWAMNYYGDGVTGGPIPWEIDQTGLAVWALWDHYRTTGGVEYLREVYPAIRRAAEFLGGYRDPTTGLPRAAHEDDNLVHSRTVVGASSVWLALDSAVRAARALGEEEDVTRFGRRRDELAAAIETHLWSPGDGAYSRTGSLLHRLFDHPRVPEVVRALPILPGTRGVPTLSWPADYADADDPRMARHLDHVWETVAPSFAEPAAGRRRFGMYESKALVALAKAWRDDPERMARVCEGVRWIAHEHATSDTHVLGEGWLLEDGDVVSVVSQPHTFTGLLFYYAALEAFPPADGS
ncbi:hypothetical protein ACFO0N_14460 [Halobium salinum]|uniref:Uncharacterized protein n=1 Tax=Halobium salinum TaxID=1364940 RepID=A0ABD5PEE9_9EURY|nr:hypothetical protein [Halobium salinum]